MNDININVNEISIYSGIALCRALYGELSKIGIFPALTGGLLYKDGFRKDIDVTLFRHRQDVESFETNDKNIAEALLRCGVEIVDFYGFVTKAKWKGVDVDLFNPETKIFFNDEYGDEE